MGAWACLTATVALGGHLHWSVAPGACVGLAALLGAVWRGSTSAWGLRPPRPPARSLLELAVAGGAVAAIAAWVAGWMPATPLTPALLALHLLWIAPSEELFFRGMLQGALRPRLRPAGAATAAAVAFGISHAVIARSPAGLLTALPGLLFGTARERQRSLVGPVFLHAAANIALAAWSGA